MKAFDNGEWETMIRRIFGKAAEMVIKQEHEQFHKNDPVRHAARLANTLEHWDEIMQIIEDELPSYESIEALMSELGMPMQPEDINVSWQDTEDAFIASRDIRDKYLTSSLLWDLGLLYDTKLER